MSSPTSSSTLLIGLYFLAIIVFTLLKRKTLPGKTTYLFRALLPSWRFFEDFDEAPTLHFRHGNEKDELSGWWKCLARPERRFYQVLYNPKANYVLAAGSLVQHLLSEINDLPDTDSNAVESLVSYQLARNLVRFHLPSDARYFQFKVSGVSDDLLLSPVYRVTP
ncbi:MAG: hypothetical protein ACJ763_07585 [Bdellovibrionia bacterium]